MYPYAGDDPTNVVDPLGLWAVGVIGGLSGETGLGVMSEGGSVSAGFGYFTGSGFGGFNTSGGFGLVPGVPGSAAQILNPPSPGDNAAAFGFSAGPGWGFFWSPNAKTPADLSGPFRTYSATVYGKTFQISTGYAADGRRIWEFAAIIFGPSRGYSLSVSNTLTTPWPNGLGSTAPFDFAAHGVGPGVGFGFSNNGTDPGDPGDVGPGSQGPGFGGW